VKFLLAYAGSGFFEFDDFEHLLELLAGVETRQDVGELAGL
jgi:hypothetical protein